MIIGIDPGVNNIGLAVLSDDASTVLDTQLWSISKPDLKGYDEFVNKLHEFLYKLKLDFDTAILAIEKPFFTPKTLANNIRTLEVIGLMKYAAYMCVKEENLIMIPPTSVKKVMTGKGNAPKELVIQAVNAKYKLEADIAVSHIADAIAIGYTAYMQRQGA
jgi:Holliday junction resolvasome RuvABC endonuclease subunit